MTTPDRALTAEPEIELYAEMRDYLEHPGLHFTGPGPAEAASAILARAEAAEADNVRLRAALGPFAALDEVLLEPGDEPMWSSPPGRIVDWLGPSDVRRAAAAIGEGEGKL
jgi:hypothetical protein